MKKLRKGLLGLVVLVALFCSVMVFMPASASAVNTCWKVAGWTEMEEDPGVYIATAEPHDGYDSGSPGWGWIDYSPNYLLVERSFILGYPDEAIWISGYTSDGKPIVKYDGGYGDTTGTHPSSPIQFMPSPPNTNDITSPTTPIFDGVDAYFPNTAILIWHGATDNVGVASYDIYRDNQKVQTVSSLNDNNTYANYTFYDLTPNTTYSVYIVAIDSSGNSSSRSNITTFTTPSDTTSPTAPTVSLASNGLTATSASLVFTGATDDVKIGYYTLYYDTASPSAAIGTSSTGSYILSGLKPLTTYKVKVFAYDTSGNCSPASNVLTFTTLADTTAPKAPTYFGLYQGGVTEKTASLIWSGASDNVGITAYEIYDGATRLKTISSTSAGVTYSLTGLTPNTTYNLTVKAKDAAGNISPASSILTIKTLPDTTAPSAPTYFVIDHGAYSYTSASLLWDGATDNVGIISYDIYNGTTKLKSVFGSAGINTYQLTGLNPDTSYNLTLKARDAAGNTSSSSPSISLRTLRDTTPPTQPGLEYIREVLPGL